MQVHIIGAGPGDPELLTLRGKRLLAACPVVLYAGSLVPEEILRFADSRVRLYNSAEMDLPALERVYLEAKEQNHDVARLHSGDPSIYGALGEQLRILQKHGIAWTMTPGVSAYAAAAAAIGQELTVPEVSQTVILTRTASKSSPMPAGEELSRLAATRATLALHLSARNLRQAVRDLSPHYGENCPAVAVWRVGWQDQEIVATTLSELHELVLTKKWTRTLLVLVGEVFAQNQPRRASALYDPNHPHIFRPHAKKQRN